MATTDQLLAQLRSRLKDDTYSVPAFTFVCLDRHATACLLTIGDGYLTTTVENGAAATDELRIALAVAPTNTLGGVLAHLAGSSGYKLTPLQGWSPDHSAFDLEPIQDKDVRREPLTIRTRRFSDAELLQFLRAGIARHNPRYSPESMPDEEVQLVLSCAHVEALRVMATDASKRRGLDADANTLLSIASQIESSYRSDVQRLAKVLVPLRSDDDGIREGDVVVGTFHRKSPRTGFQAPSVGNVRPNPPQIHDVSDADAFDYGLVIRWRRSSHSNLLAVELWRDETPDVRRSRNSEEFQTTSKLVWSSRHQPSGRFQESWGTKDRGGELIGMYADGFFLPSAEAALPTSPEPAALEPGTTYYYKLYVVDAHGEFAESIVVQGQTKPARARFARPGTNALSVSSGPRAGGTSFVITGANFTDNVERVLIGGKACTFTVDSATTLTCASPGTGEFTEATQDVVIESRSGLKDVLPKGWTYT